MPFSSFPCRPDKLHLQALPRYRRCCPVHKNAANLLELIHKRRKHSSTIFCSQYLEEDWYENMGGKDNLLTDAIMDRIAFDSYKIPIKSIDPEKDISMREVYGLDPSLAQ